MVEERPARREFRRARLYSSALGRVDCLFRPRAREASCCFVRARGCAGAPWAQGAGIRPASDRFVGDFEVGAPGGSSSTTFSTSGTARSPRLGVRRDAGSSRASRGPDDSHHGCSMFGHNESTLLLWNGGGAGGRAVLVRVVTLFPRGWRAPHGGILPNGMRGSRRRRSIGFSARADGADLTILSGLIDERTNGAAVDRVVPLLPTPLEGRWNDFVMHVGWSTRNVGFVDVYHRVEGRRRYGSCASCREHADVSSDQEGRESVRTCSSACTQAATARSPRSSGVRAASASSRRAPSTTTLRARAHLRRSSQERVPGLAAERCLQRRRERFSKRGSRLAAVDVRVARPREHGRRRGCRRCPASRVEGRSSGRTHRRRARRPRHCRADLSAHTTRRDRPPPPVARPSSATDGSAGRRAAPRRQETNAGRALCRARGARFASPVHEALCVHGASTSTPASPPLRAQTRVKSSYAWLETRCWSRFRDVSSFALRISWAPPGARGSTCASASSVTRDVEEERSALSTTSSSSAPPRAAPRVSAPRLARTGALSNVIRQPCLQPLPTIRPESDADTLPLRICVMTDCAHGIGGMQRHTHDLVQGLVGRGHEVEVICPADPSLDPRAYGARWHLVDTPGRTDKRWREKFRATFIEADRRNPFHIVHSESTAAHGLLFRPRVSHRSWSSTTVATSA